MEIIKKLEIAKNQLQTVTDFLRFSVSLFNSNNLYYGHGTDNAFDEAVYLLLATLNLPVDKLEPFLNAKLLDYEKIAILEALEQRVIKRIPTAYICKKAFLANHSFYVDYRTIIPRSFIAHILSKNELIPWIDSEENVKNILDLCTGNGSLAIIAGLMFPHAKIVASDISNDALEVAKINCNNYKLNKQIKFVKSNLFKNLSKYKESFDIIITNPPYVSANLMKDLPKEYSYEPKLSLQGGNNGLKSIISILKNAKQFLSPRGIIVVEMGDNVDELIKLYPEIPFIWLENDGFVFVLTKNDLVRYFP